MKTYNLFISHSWKYSNALHALRNLLDSDEDFHATYHERTVDAPIHSENQAYIRRVLSAEIAQSDVVLALGGVYASYSEWMEWELDTATKKGIPIIAVKPRAQERLSTTVTSKAREIVSWNTKSIVAAIRRAAKTKQSGLSKNAGWGSYPFGLFRAANYRNWLNALTSPGQRRL